MKKLLMFLMLALFCIPWAANAQTTVEIGVQTGTNSYLPTYSFYNYSLTQQIYTAEEIGMAGTINSIAFKSTGQTKTRTLDIYLVETNKATFSGTSDWITVTAANLVYSGSVTFTANEWITLELINEFVYDGTSNLAVIVDDNTGSYSSGLNCGVFAGTSQAIRVYSDGTNYDPSAPAYTGTVLSVKNILQLDITPAGGVTCDKPESINVSDITSSSAHLNWVGQSNTYNVEYKKASESDWISWQTNYVGNAAILNNLDLATTYNVRVQSVCGDATSGWKTVSFTTACDVITTFPWTEDFEGLAVGNLVDPCWVNEHIDGGGSQIFKVYSSTSGIGGNTTHLLQLPDQTAGTMTKLVLPVMTLPANYELSIDVYRSNNTYQSYPYELEGIYVYASTDGEIEGATELAFIPRHYQVSNDVIPAEEAVGWYNYELPIGMSGTCYIILKGVNQYCTSTYMDNFAVKAMPTCFKPTSLSYADVTAHTATLSWTSDAAAWQICINDDEENLIDVTETSYSLINLNENTTYTAKVRTNCGNDGYSEWSNVVNFTTPIACPAPSGINVNNVTAATATVNWTGTADGYNVMYRTAASAEGIYEEFNNSGVPSGWTKYQGLVDGVLDGSVTLTTGGNWATTTYALGQYNMKLNIYGTSCKSWIVTPEFTLDQNLSFDLALTAYNSENAASGTCDDDRFVVLIYANNAWAILREWNNTGSEYVYNDIATEGENVSIDLQPYMGQNVKIAFYGESTVGNNGDNDLHIDNVYCGTPIPASEWMTADTDATTYTLTGLNPEMVYEVKVASDCPGEIGHETSVVSFTTKSACEIPTNLAYDNLTANSVELSWNENGLATSWYIEYTTTIADDPEPVVEMIEVTENPYTLTDLIPETTYEVHVIPSCAVVEGDPLNNMWSNTITITTPPSCPAPTDLTYTIHTNGVTINWNGTSDSYNLRYGVDNGYDLVAVDFEDQSIPQMCENDAVYPWTIEAGHGGYYIQSGNAGVSSSTSVISITNNFAHDGIIEFDAQCMGEGTSWDVCKFYIDDELQFSKGDNGSQWDHYKFNITSGEHTLTWSYTKDGSVNKPGDHFAVDNVKYHIPAIVWNDPINVPDTTRELGSLNPGLYLLAVQGVCDGETGAWSDTLTFVVPSCTIAMDGVESFEGYTTNTKRWTGAIPPCWTIAHHYKTGPDTVAMIYYSPAFAGDGSYSLRLHHRGIVAMPALPEDIDLSRLQLNMTVRQSKSYYSLQVGVMTDLNEESSFVPVALCDNATTEPLPFKCNFANYTAPEGYTGPLYIAFKNIGTSNSDSHSVNYLDEIDFSLVEEMPTCAITALVYPEDFEEVSIAEDGRLVPACWTLPDAYNNIPTKYKPQLYKGFATNGIYSLRLRDLCTYVMPEYAVENTPIQNVKMTFSLRQPNRNYRLEVGVMTDANDTSTFVLVQRINNQTQDIENVEVSFANYVTPEDAENLYIAFRNVGYSAAWTYSYNYIDSIRISEVTDNEEQSKIAEAEGDNAFDVDRYLENITVYPNPTTGNLHIDAADVQKVEVFNQMGQLVGMYGSEQTIDLGSLTTGVYMIHITVPQGTTVRKVVKR